MSRINSAILAIFTAAIIAASVLYVIRANPVHEAIPEALAALQADPSPKPLPVTSFVDAEGHTHSPSEFKGSVVILNMWATWCAPCVRELPAIARLQATLGRNSVSIVTVNASHDSAAETEKFLKAHDAASLPPYRDPDLSLLSAFGAQGLPFSVVIDAKGREIARASGPMNWDDPAAIAYFKSLGAHAAS